MLEGSTLNVVSVKNFIMSSVTGDLSRICRALLYSHMLILLIDVVVLHNGRLLLYSTKTHQHKNARQECQSSSPRWLNRLIYVLPPLLFPLFFYITPKNSPTAIKPYIISPYLALDISSRLCVARLREIFRAGRDF